MVFFFWVTLSVGEIEEGAEAPGRWEARAGLGLGLVVTWFLFYFVLFRVGGVCPVRFDGVWTPMRCPSGDCGMRDLACFVASEGAHDVDKVGDQGFGGSIVR